MKPDTYAETTACAGTEPQTLTQPTADVAGLVDRARVFYLAMYGAEGGKWEAVDPRHHYVWIDKAERHAKLLAAYEAHRGGEG